MKKKALIALIIVSVIVTLSVLLLVFFGHDGKCGQKASWDITSDGELVISGKGETDGYAQDDTPWHNKASEIKQVTVKSGITTLGDNLFKGCTSLETVTLSESVETVESSVFDGCHGLSEIIVMADNPSFKSSDGVLFSKDETVLMKYPPAKKDKSYDIPKTVVTVATSSFEGAENLEEVSFPKKLMYIESLAFSSCSSLKKVVLPNGVESLGTQAFCFCSSLDYIVIPGNIDAISTAALTHCTVLDEIYFTGSEEQWQNLLVEGNNNWSVEPTVKFIIDFGFCGGNTEYFIDRNRTLSLRGNGNTDDFSKDSSPFADYADKILSVEIGDGITGIGAFAFSSLKRVESITIPKTVLNVGNSAFSGFTSSQLIKVQNTERFVREHWAPSWNQDCDAEIIYYK